MTEQNTPAEPQTQATDGSTVTRFEPQEQTAPADQELVEAIRLALQRSEEPLRVNQLRKLLTGPFRRSEEELARVVQQQVQAGRLFEFPRYGTSPKPRYWAYDARQYARRLLLRAARRSTLTYNDLKKKLASPLRGFPDSETKGLLEEMVARRELWQHPPRRRGAATRYSVEPPRPADYLKDVLDRLEKWVRVLEQAGVSVERTLADLGELVGQRFGQTAQEALLPGRSAQSDATADTPATPTEPRPAQQASQPGQVGAQSQPFETVPPQAVAARSPAPSGAGEGPPEARWNLDAVAEQILAAMPKVHPRASEGALVSIRRLRTCPELLGVPKDVFDRAALTLAERQVVALHRHDYPSSLAPEERQQMVQDERGNCYVGIAMRVGE